MTSDQYVEKATLALDPDLFGFRGYFENPDSVLSTQSAGKGIKLYDEIARDPHTFSVLQTRYLAVVGKEWSVVPAGNPRLASKTASATSNVQIAKFVESVLMDCNFDQLRLEILQAILYGYYGAEIIWKVKNGNIVIDRFLGKHPRRFRFTLEREPRLLTPSTLVEGEPLPDRKFLIFQYGDSDNPYGQGLGQKLWWPVWFKKHGIKFWMIFMEKFGMPTPIGRYPAQAKEQRDKLLNALKTIQTETAIVIPDTMQIDLMEAARQGDGSYEASCRYFDRQISKAVLGQTLTAEVDEHGSYAASRVHNDVRQDILEADADLLDAYLNQTLIRWIVDYNYPGVQDYPQIVTHASQKLDLATRITIDKTLVEMGLPISRSYFYETYGINEPDRDTPLVTNSGIPSPSSVEEPEFTEEGASLSAQQAQHAVDDLVEITSQNGARIFVEMGDLIADLAAQCTSVEEFRDKLFSLYPKLDTQQLENLLIRSMTTARLHGRATIADKA